MFWLLFGKKEVEKVREDTKKSFEDVKKDVQTVVWTGSFCPFSTNSSTHIFGFWGGCQGKKKRALATEKEKDL